MDLDIKVAILRDEGYQLHSTTLPEYEQSMRETLERLSNNHKDREYVLRDYHAHISRRNPKTMVVTEWHKEPGFSIWEKK